MENRQFKAKLRQIGNSQGVYIPKKVITGYNIGDVITLSLEGVITNVYTGNKQKVITPQEITKPNFNTAWCKKHDVMKGTCGCK